MLWVFVNLNMNFIHVFLIGSFTWESAPGFSRSCHTVHPFESRFQRDRHLRRHFSLGRSRERSGINIPSFDSIQWVSPQFNLIFSTYNSSYLKTRQEHLDETLPLITNPADQNKELEKDGIVDGNLPANRLYEINLKDKK